MLDFLIHKVPYLTAGWFGFPIHIKQFPGSILSVSFLLFPFLQANMPNAGTIPYDIT
jgi:hypothetical protein